MTGFKVAAKAEARWFVNLVRSGRMLADEARESIQVSDDVRAVWAEAGEWDGELRALLTEVASFRDAVLVRFEALLARPESPIKEAKIVKRGKSRSVRLPIAHAELLSLAADVKES